MSPSSCFQEFYHAFSFKKCYLFLFIFITTITLILGSTTLIILFILKPHEPKFSLRTIKLESYELDVSGSNLLVSSVVSLTLIAENPNKFGVRYNPTRFHVLCGGLDVGNVRVPGFYQPPHAKNSSFETRALFHSVNVSEILSAISPPRRNNDSNDSFKTSIIGDVVAEVRLLHVYLPKIKIALECNISIDPSYAMFSMESLFNAKAVKNHTISLPINSQSYSKECSIAIYI